MHKMFYSVGCFDVDASNPLFHINVSQQMMEISD